MASISSSRSASVRALWAAVALAASCCGIPRFARAAEAYDRIEVLGVTALPGAEIEAMFQGEINSGVEQLRRAYADLGYRNAEVSGAIVRERGLKGASDLILRLVVREGSPTFVKSIDLVEVRQMDQQRPQIWNRFLAELESPLVQRVGSIAATERRREVERLVEGALVAGDYAGSKVVRVDEVMAGPLQVRWVVQVQLGDSITVGFQGQKLISQQDLQSAVDELRAAGLGDDYQEAIARKITELYLSRGLSQVRLELLTREFPEAGTRHLSYRIDEGPVVRLGRLNFDGNSSFSDSVLKRQLLKAAPEALQGGIYVEADLRAAAEAMVDWMRAQGYLSARIVSIQPVFRTVERGARADVTVYLAEGPQTLLRSFNVTGVTLWSRDELLTKLALREGSPLDLYGLTKGIERLRSDYREAGYWEAQVVNAERPDVVRYSNKNQFADVQIEVHEGLPSRVGSIEVLGLVATEQEVVQRELLLKPGDLMRESRIQESERRLRSMGIFVAVRIESYPGPARPDGVTKDLRLVLTEGNPGRVSGGLGFRNDLGLRVFGELGYGNLWRKNHLLSLTAEANRRIEDFCRNRFNAVTGAPQTSICFVEYELGLSYNWPWLFWGPTALRPAVKLEHRRFFQFDAQTASLTTSLERQLIPEIKLVGTFAHSLERTVQENSTQEIDNQTLTIGALAATFTVDRRDDPLDPTQGFFGWLSADFAAPWLGSQASPFPVSYARAQIRLDHHLSLGQGWNWYVSARAGYERNLVDPNGPDVPASQRGFVGVPLVKQFALGGVGSVRGFNIQEINAQDRVIQGSLSYVNYRTQLEVPLSGNLKFGPFVDAANLRVDSFSFGDLRYGVGLGVRYRSPVGPINFDWGFKLDPRPTDPDWNRFYFSIGIL